MKLISAEFSLFETISNLTSKWFPLLVQLFLHLQKKQIAILWQERNQP